MTEIKRRGFLAGTAAVAGACACGAGACKMITGVGDTPAIPAGAYMVQDNKVQVALDKTPELAKVGGSVKIEDENLPTPIIIARTGDREYAAVSMKCTHGDRDLEYVHSDKKFRCVSFGHSEFNEDGELLKGPAEKPVEGYRTSLGLLSRDKLTIHLG